MLQSRLYVWYIIGKIMMLIIITFVRPFPSAVQEQSKAFSIN